MLFEVQLKDHTYRAECIHITVKFDTVENVTKRPLRDFCSRNYIKSA